MNVLLVYGSTGGNTQFLSEFVKLGLEDSGHVVTVKNVKHVDMNELKNFEALVLGSSTWNLDKLQGQLQQDWRARLDEFLQLDLQQKPVAVFGVGHYHYTFTAGAADRLIEGLQKVNGKLVQPVFRVDDVVDLFSEQIRDWARGLFK